MWPTACLDAIPSGLLSPVIWTLRLRVANSGHLLVALELLVVALDVTELLQRQARLLVRWDVVDARENSGPPAPLEC
jgi:hypothetical protein